MVNYLKKVNQLESSKILKILSWTKPISFSREYHASKTFSWTNVWKPNCVPAKHKHGLNQREDSRKALLLWFPLDSLLQNRSSLGSATGESWSSQKLLVVSLKSKSFSHIKCSKQFFTGWSADSEILKRTHHNFYHN